MNLTVSSRARDYILNKGGSVNLIPHDAITLCCGRPSLCPSVQLGIPGNHADYEMHVIEGVSVYVPYGFEPQSLLTIELRNLFGLKTLSLEGWKLV